MEAKPSLGSRAALATAALALITFSTGCVGLLAQLGYWTGGTSVAAEFAGLEGKRVAVICVTETSTLGPGTDSLLLAREAGTILAQKVKNVDVVRPDEIADWIDRHDWNEVDVVEVGRGVHAEMVVAIDLSGLGLYDGKTLYKGRANLSVRVFDLTEGGKEVFRRNLPEQTFPANGAYPATEASEAKFRRAFIQVLAQQAMRFFHAHEMMEDISRDPASIS